MQPGYYIVLAAILFTIGAVGVLIRRNAIVLFMCIELMLNASNLALVTFGRINGTLDGQIMAVPVGPSGGSFRVGKPHRATTQRYQTRGQNRMFDMSPDGRLALATAPPPADRKESGSVVLISNFSTELARAPDW